MLVGFSQVAQPDHSGKNQEQFHVTVLAHGGQCWHEMLCLLDLCHQVAH